MKVSFDEAKRAWTLQKRGLDFVDAPRVFDDPNFTQEDDRYAYSSPRYQTYGLMNGRLIMFAWEKTQAGIRVISMRKCNEREQKIFNARLG
jgi:uncharacterized protein